MRVKKINRYWCDFCNRGGLQSFAMSKHEKHCTLNPNRKCRVCDLLGVAPVLQELIDMLPDPTTYNTAECLAQKHEETEHYKLTQQLEEIYPAFRDAAGDCPACMMAALRLKKIPVPMMEKFNFKAEMKSIFDGINESRRDYY